MIFSHLLTDLLISCVIIIIHDSDSYFIIFFSLFAFTSFRFNLFMIKFNLLMNFFRLKVCIQGISKLPRNNTDL